MGSGVPAAEDDTGPAGCGMPYIEYEAFCGQWASWHAMPCLVYAH